MNPTNDPALRSFVPVPPESHFPIQNLPYGVFRRRGDDTARAGVAIGDSVLDLTLLERLGLLFGPVVASQHVFQDGKLNPFLARGSAAWAEVRARVSRLLRADEPGLRDDPLIREQVLVPQ